MNEIAEKDVINIENMIYEIDGKEVMLDTDLAKLYNVETKRINEAVKNNPEKFPDRYLFRITDKEYNSLKSKFSTSKGGSRKGHTAFVEQGIYMLATILKSDVATEISIRIMDTFVKMRHYIKYNEQLLPRKYLLLEEKEDNNTKRIDELRNINRKIIVISSNINDTLKKKYLKQYNNIKFINNESYHDRFIIIDRKRVFHCGASFKDLGKKCFAINEIENKIENDKLINNIIKNCSIDN